jgi:hypothetical protein
VVNGRTSERLISDKGVRGTGRASRCCRKSSEVFSWVLVKNDFAFNRRTYLNVYYDLPS